MIVPKRTLLEEVRRKSLSIMEMSAKDKGKHEYDSQCVSERPASLMTFAIINFPTHTFVFLQIVNRVHSNRILGEEVHRMATRLEAPGTDVACSVEQYLIYPSATPLAPVTLHPELQASTCLHSSCNPTT
jgi:hypothetical protein